MTCIYTPDPVLVAAQNDAFRKGACGLGPRPARDAGIVVCTHALSARDPAFLAKARRAIGEIDTFDPENDPDGFHDFGAVCVDGQKVWFKLDLYERGSEFRFGAETPDDPARTVRVMTLMLPSDW